MSWGNPSPPAFLSVGLDEANQDLGKMGGRGRSRVLEALAGPHIAT